MTDSSILVLDPLTTAGHNAARRAALLARQHGWALRILHVERDAGLLPAAKAAVEQLCAQLQDRLDIAPTAEVVAGDLLKRVVQHAHACGLVVIGSSRDNPLMAKVAGVPMDRLIRLCRAPTLIVKRTVDAAFAQGATQTRGGDRYARVLACVDLEPTAQATVAAAAGIAPGAQLEVFHAVAASHPPCDRPRERTSRARPCWGAPVRHWWTCWAAPASMPPRRPWVSATPGRPYSEGSEPSPRTWS